ncbi:MAG TPA: D-alanyl-D-alanine carboxypeptidase family protein [Clostridiales bacterium]|nr:D-alanyl-D-alanine carboxypeptidase family protein [Clostridiales bacterium]
MGNIQSTKYKKSGYGTCWVFRKYLISNVSLSFLYIILVLSLIFTAFSGIVYADNSSSLNSPIVPAADSVSYAANLELPELNIEAEGYILIDSRTGLVLYSENADKTEIYPASTTKIMTAIIALENEDINKVMTASQAAIDDIGPGGMNIGIMPGEELTLWDLLNAMLVCSANEAANIIAENTASSRNEFIDLMNKRAKELGAVNTHFINTNGMHHMDHYTTARDMALIARHAMSLPAFREIVKKDSYTMPSTNKHSTWNTLYTTNKLLRYGTKTNCNFNIIGIKTGFTTPAGHNLVSAAVNEEGMELISVILGVKNERAPENIYKYTETLLKYGFENYSLRTLIKQNSPAGNVSVKDAKDKAVLNLIAETDVSSVFPANLSYGTPAYAYAYVGKDKDTDASNDVLAGEDKSANAMSNNWSVIKKVHVTPTISAPINEGEVLGYMEFWKGDILLGKTNLITSTSVEKSNKPKFIRAIQKLAGNIARAFSGKSGSIKNSALYKIAKSIFIILFSFGALRFSLRRISRIINIKRRMIKYRSK